MSGAPLRAALLTVAPLLVQNGEYLSLRPETPTFAAVAADGGAHSDDGWAASLLDLPVIQMAEAEEATAFRALARGWLATRRITAPALVVALGHRVPVDEVLF